MIVDKINATTQIKPLKSENQKRSESPPELGAVTRNHEKYEGGDTFFDRRKIEESVELLNKTMESYNTELQFSLHEASGEYQVKIVNTSNNKVIKELPAESVLNMVAYFKEMLGIVVDKFI